MQHDGEVDGDDYDVREDEGKCTTILTVIR